MKCFISIITLLLINCATMSYCLYAEDEYSINSSESFNVVSGASYNVFGELRMTNSQAAAVALQAVFYDASGSQIAAEYESIIAEYEVTSNVQAFNATFTAPASAQISGVKFFLVAVMSDNGEIGFSSLSIKESAVLSSSNTSTGASHSASSGESKSFAYVNGRNILDGKNGASTSLDSSTSALSETETQGGGGLNNVIYVHADNGSDVADGFSMMTAKKTLRSALMSQSVSKIIMSSNGGVFRSCDINVSGKTVTIRPQGTVTIRGN